MEYASCQIQEQGKGSLLLTCPKMPIGIFLFVYKSEFQKSNENGVKRRKPEKISGFSVGIFFVKTCQKKDTNYYLILLPCHNDKIFIKLSIEYGFLEASL